MVKKDISVSVILNVYKRPETLQAQLECIQNQSMKVDEVLVWLNGIPDNDMTLIDEVINKSALNVKTFRASRNEGVWPRFLIGFLAKSEYLCLLDDDVAPGELWLENAIRCSKKFNAVCGTRGLIFRTKGKYFPFYHYGWGNPNETDIEVDIIGHAWLFKRKWLYLYWNEKNSMEISDLAGEDMNLTASLQKHGIKTFVPMHPADNKSLWGNAYFDESVGQDRNSISLRKDAYEKFDKHLSFYIKNGFKLQCEKGEGIVSRERNIRISRNGSLYSFIYSNRYLYSYAKFGARILRKLGIHI
jgi:glycosyltransferase involved in cell wall biosynthesis